jgi:hypothetical protein
MTTPGSQFPVLGDAWWIILTASSNAGSGYMIVQGTQAEIDKKYGGPPTVRGPYNTKADAEKAAQSAVGSGSGNISTQGPPGSSTLPNPLAALGEIAHWAGVIVTHLTDLSMWISLGWIALGLVLLAVGITVWLKLPQKVGAVGRAVERTATPVASALA